MTRVSPQRLTCHEKRQNWNADDLIPCPHAVVLLVDALQADPEGFSGNLPGRLPLRSPSVAGSFPVGFRFISTLSAQPVGTGEVEKRGSDAMGAYTRSLTADLTLRESCIFQALAALQG